MRLRISIPVFISVITFFVLKSICVGEVETISTNLRAFGLDVALREIRVGSPTGPQMNAPNFNIGQLVNYSGPKEVNFYLRASNNDESTANGFSPSSSGDNTFRIASVKLNPDWRETLLIWSQINDYEYSILALPNDLQALPANHIRFINTTSRRIGLEIRQGSSVILAPGQYYILNSDENEAVYFWSAMEVNGTAGERLSNVVEMRAHLRRTVFLTYSNSAATGHDPRGAPQFGFFVVTHN